MSNWLDIDEGAGRRELTPADRKRLNIEEPKVESTPAGEKPEDPAPTADEVVGKVARARSDERKREILESAGVEVGEGWQTFEQMEQAIEDVINKKIKRELITSSATVGIPGRPASTGDDYESLMAELEAERAKPTSLKSMNRRRQILQKLEELS